MPSLRLCLLSLSLIVLSEVVWSVVVAVWELFCLMLALLEWSFRPELTSAVMSGLVLAWMSGEKLSGLRLDVRSEAAWSDLRCLVQGCPV